MQTVSIETSVVSFLRENLSASPESVERQLLTRKWWSIYRHRYELVTSQYVVDEARVGQTDRAQERLGIWPKYRLCRSAMRSMRWLPKS